MKNNIFKCFGISKEEIKTILSPFLQDNKGVFISVEGNQLLVDITLQADDNNAFFYEVSREIFERFNKYIYAETDISLEQTAFELLNILHLKIATAESVTGGALVSSLIKRNKGASKVVLEGNVVYSDESKIETLGVDPQTLKKYTSISVETTYELAKKQLEKSSADIVIATTGRAETGENIFIAIGDRRKIDVYKNNFFGTRQDIIDTIVQASLFYLVKKIRKNDFLFE